MALPTRINYMLIPEIKAIEKKEIQVSDHKVIVSDNDVMEMIISAVSEYLNVHTVYCLKRSRKREYVYFRQLCMYFIMKNTAISLRQIGERFGGKHHTTVINSTSVISDFIHIKDDKVLNDITNIKKLYEILYSSTSHNKLY